MKRQPRLCLLIDEAGYFFSGVTDAKTKGTAQHAIKPALLELWSSAHARWVGKQRVPKDGKSKTPPVVIENPHLCLYSTSQPQILFEGLTRNDLRDGWLARNLFFISRTRPKPTFRTQFIRRAFRDEYVQDLIEGNEIVVRAFADGRSHGEKLVLAQDFRGHTP